MEQRGLSIPPELENMLLEYTINAIVTEPDDYVSHAAEYFTKLRDKNKSTLPEDEEPPEGSREHISKILGQGAARRGTVMGESYNPEEEEDDDLDVEVTPKSDEERNRIKSAAANIFLFRVLDDVDLGAVIDAMIPMNVEEGQIIIKQGDDGDYFYLVDKGNYDIFIQDSDGNENKVGQYENDGYFGELALLHNQPRAATIKATSDGSLWAVNRKTFNKLIVKRAFQKRQMYMQLLEGVPQLKPLTDYERMQVADALCGKSYSEGDIIVKEGDEGDGMYFIVEGKVRCRRKRKKETETGEETDEETDKETDEETEYDEVGQLGKGEYFGELALVKDQPRAATVVALEDTKAAFLDVKAFERLLGPCMEIMKRHTESYEKKSKS